MEISVQWERHPVRDCYHVYSDGTRLSVLFETIQDKVYARNLIAVLAFLYNIRIYCDVVMDTHFHLVGHGRPEDIERFKAQLKRLLIKYFNRTGRGHILKEGIWIEADPLADDVEVMDKIIYVFRNPMDAGYPYLPENYPWGVGRLFFHVDSAVAVRRVGDMTIDERRTMLHTRANIPDEWELDANGMLLPRSYIDIDTVHRLFGLPRRFIAFLFVRKKDLSKQDEQCARAFLEKRGDSVLRAEAEEQSQRLFNRAVTKLTQAERIQVAGILWQDRRTFSRKQLARAVKVTPALIEAIFH